MRYIFLVTMFAVMGIVKPMHEGLVGGEAEGESSAKRAEKAGPPRPPSGMLGGDQAPIEQSGASAPAKESWGDWLKRGGGLLGPAPVQAPEVTVPVMLSKTPLQRAYDVLGVDSTMSTEAIRNRMNATLDAYKDKPDVLKPVFERLTGAYNLIVAERAKAAGVKSSDSQPSLSKELNAAYDAFGVEPTATLPEIRKIMQQKIEAEGPESRAKWDALLNVIDNARTQAALERAKKG